MSLLGIDVGTTGCKAALFTPGGALLGTAYREYDVARPAPGYAELDAQAVWDHVQACIAEAAAQAPNDPPAALCVSSLGEAVVPVSADRRVLGPSLLNFDERGAAYVGPLGAALDAAALYRINGNTLGNHYTLTKLCWLRDHRPALYAETAVFLHWAAFIAYMLGADPAVDYSLANRTLLFDLDAEAWSPELLAWAGLDPDKLPALVPAGAPIGTVAPHVAARLGLPRNVTIVAGAHDQCANAIGCGVVEEGRAMLGMGTFHCIVPVYAARPAPDRVRPYGYNTEHHAAPDRYVSFLFNHGGSLFKWFRDTFAASERERADIYPALLAEMPDGPSPVFVLPHFAPTGPPEFVADSSGVMTGLKLDTTRGDILKGILEGTIFYLREAAEPLEAAGVDVTTYTAAGGGSRSDAWLAIAADILGKPVTRLKEPDAGALGSAILAGAAAGVFDDLEEGVAAMVAQDCCFEPDPARRAAYDARFAHYRRLWPTCRDFLRGRHDG